MNQIYILGSDEYWGFVMNKTPFEQQEIFEPISGRTENNELCAGTSVDTLYRHQFGIYRSPFAQWYMLCYCFYNIFRILLKASSKILITSSICSCEITRGG